MQLSGIVLTFGKNIENFKMFQFLILVPEMPWAARFVQRKNYCEVTKAHFRNVFMLTVLKKIFFKWLKLNSKLSSLSEI